MRCGYLLVQESRLAESQSAELLDEAFVDFSNSVHNGGKRIIELYQAGTIDSALVFVSEIQNQQLVRIQADPSDYSGTTYGRALQKAERLEFTSNNAAAAIQAYLSAWRISPDSSALATTTLALARLHRKSGNEKAALDHLLKVSSYSRSIQDEFGVPLALYAIGSIAQHFPESTPNSKILAGHIHRPIKLSAQAAFQYRTIRDSVRNTFLNGKLLSFSTFVDEAISMVRLREDFGSLRSQLAPGRDGIGYSPFKASRD